MTTDNKQSETHIEALSDLRIGVEMDRHNLPDADAKLAALDAALAVLRGADAPSDDEIIADMEARGWRYLNEEERTDIIGFARDFLSRYAAPQASAEPDLRGMNPIGLTPPQKELQRRQYQRDAEVRNAVLEEAAKLVNDRRSNGLSTDLRSLVSGIRALKSAPATMASAEPAQMALLRGRAQDEEPRVRHSCNMGVGCEEYGVCYAAAHGEPGRCGMPDTQGDDLPPLPEPVDSLALADGFNVIGVQDVFTAEQMRAYVLADRQQREGDVAALREALKFYADQDHFIIADDDAWDTVSGEPQNFFCDEAGTATVEDGSIARAALAAQPASGECRQCHGSGEYRRSLGGAQAERERQRRDGDLIEALRPFAAVEDADLEGTAFQDKDDDTPIIYFHRTGKRITIGDFRRAGAALAAVKGESNG